MKVSRIIGVLSLAAAFALIAGCSKQEQPAARTAPAATATEKPAAEADKPAVQAAPAIAPAAAIDTATAASSQAQGLIDKAKSLVDSNQYADASKILQELANLKLTPEQQKVVDDLKAIVQKKLADQGISAVGGLLNK